MRKEQTSFKFFNFHGKMWSEKILRKSSLSMIAVVISVPAIASNTAIAPTYVHTFNIHKAERL